MIKNGITSIPILDTNQEYIGMVKKSDLFFIVKTNEYELLLKNAEFFLDWLKKEKACYKATSFEGTEFYFPTDTLQQLVEKLLFASGNRVVRIDEQTKQIKGVITLTDLFLFYIGQKAK
eukprot:TRINITY_DN12723_c0_g1_i2.p3 TRINITY_DN12723_c0_g1~~TRINITY_DN12723_c0_g1_i2.p3  ORF type:complete len:119 (-),score=18.01 TRINITY_DN12723_c0_g1_i2:60-416(-)